VSNITFDAPWNAEIYADRGNGTSLALEFVVRNSRLKSRNVVVGGRRTSVRLEPAMWDALKDIAGWERRTVNEIVSAVAESRTATASLTSAIRIFVMAYFRARSQMMDKAA
jgi:predicted DNA-binding ribbon-helix-helix protein